MGEHIKDVGEHDIVVRVVNDGERCAVCHAGIYALRNGGGWRHAERTPKEERDGAWRLKRDTMFSHLLGGSFQRQIAKMASSAAKGILEAQEDEPAEEPVG